MERIGKLIGDMGNMEILDLYTCPKCNREVKTVRMKIIGGEKKGQWQILKNECDCRLASETIEAARQAKIKFFERFSILNDDLKNAEFSNFKAEYESLDEAVERIYHYLETFTKKESIYIYGDKGRGKSHLAVSAYKFVKNLGYTSLFFDVPKLLNVIRSIIRKDVDFSENDLFSAIESVDLLILDDIGAERKTEWVEEVMFLLINQRQGKSTIYTSNLDIKELEERYGGRIADRIKNKMDETHLIKINTPHSYRSKNLTMNQ